MKKLITVCQVLVIATVMSSLALAEYFNLTAHDITGDGTGTISGFTMSVTNTLPYSSLTGVPTTFPAHWDNITNTPTTIAGYGITDSMVQDNVAITGGTIDNTTITLLDNSVSPAKLQYNEGSTGDNTLFYRSDGKWISPSVSFQDQIDLKQALDADLTVLSFPTAWRIFYSNGAQAITELALGDNNTYFKSNGSSAAPTFSTVTATTATALAANGANCSAGQSPLGVDNTGAVEGCWTPAANLDNTTMDNTTIGTSTPVEGHFTTLSATGVSTLDNVVISEGTLDNVVIGGTTALAGSFTDIVGTTITVGSVNDTEFGYLNGVTSAIQTQIDLKAPIIDPTFTNNITVDNEVTALQYNSSAGDGEHFINVANSTPPNVGTETVGDCYFDNGTLVWACWNGSAYAAPSFTTVAYGSAPTVDSAGELGVDNTADQFVYFGTAERVLTYKRAEKFVIKSYTAADDNVVRMTFEDNVTLTGLSCNTGGASDNVTATVYVCDNNVANCSTSGLSSAATSTTVTDSSASAGAVTDGAWIKVALTDLVGTGTSLACIIRYVITRQ